MDPASQDRNNQPFANSNNNANSARTGGNQPQEIPIGILITAMLDFIESDDPASHSYTYDKKWGTFTNISC